MAATKALVLLGLLALFALATARSDDENAIEGAHTVAIGGSRALRTFFSHKFAHPWLTPVVVKKKEEKEEKDEEEQDDEEEDEKKDKKKDKKKKKKEEEEEEEEEGDDKKKVIVVKVEKEEPKKDAKVVYLVDKKP